MAALLKAAQCAAVWCAGIGFGMSRAVPVVMADGNSHGEGKGKIKPSELPIYEEPEDLYDISYHVSGKGQVQEGVQVVRKELSGVVDATKEFRQQLDHYYQTGRAHTAGELAYLREEENVVARVGAITTSGLLGLLLAARRRGFFRKLFYTSAGAGATAALLYPQHARHYTQEAVVNAGTYATVAYNFLIGVKPNGMAAPPSLASTADDSGKSASGSRGVVESESDIEPKASPARETAEKKAAAEKDLVVKMALEAARKEGLEGDPGQSHPDDADMYTTRS